MRKLATNFAAAAFTLATFTFAPIPAFAIQIGPFHLGVPLFGHHHQYRHLHMRAHAHEVRRHREAHHRGSFRGAPPHELTTRELPQEEARRTNQAEHPKGQAEPASPLLYPIGPLATMFQNILWGPAPSSIWPIGYETVFSSAFAQTPTEPDQCHQPVNAKAISERLRGLIGASADQISLLQQLNHAIDTGSDRLGNSCPTKIPHEPMARLQLMLQQIEALTTAIDLIRQPLENFEESLTQEQKTRLATEAMSTTAAAGVTVKTEIHSCGSPSATVDSSVEQIEKSVQVSEEQQTAVDNLHQALSRAANDLETDCSMPVPQSAVARLNALEDRLDATWRAILSIQDALHNFDSNLSPDQKNRLKTMTFAAQNDSARSPQAGREFN